MDSFSLLVVDDDIDTTETIAGIFSRQGYQVFKSISSIASLQTIRKHTIDCAIIDLRMPEMDGLELLEVIKKESSHTSVIMLTAYGGVDTAVEAVKKGASYFFEKPFNINKLVTYVSQIEAMTTLKKENAILRQGAVNAGMPGVMKPFSEPMIRLRKKITDIAATDATVLVTGETGSGKEIAAKEIHMLSSRKGKPFMTIDCTSLPEALMESELFGHAKGAFTGAVKDSPGLFRSADSGTVFLDEIGELPYHLQAKLLRVIHEQEVRAVGDTRTYPVDTRIIAATNRSLEEEIRNGRFREDLYYRLNVVQIKIPPLRERKDDILPLAAWFSKKYSTGEAASIGRDAAEILQNYSWPGNVRELENVIRRAVIFPENGVITEASLPERLSGRKAEPEPPEKGLSCDAAPEDDTFAAWEKAAIVNALKKSGNNKCCAASILGIGKDTLYRKIREYAL